MLLLGNKQAPQIQGHIFTKHCTKKFFYISIFRKVIFTKHSCDNYFDNFFKKFQEKKRNLRQNHYRLFFIAVFLVVCDPSMNKLCMT